VIRRTSCSNPCELTPSGDALVLFNAETSHSHIIVLISVIQLMLVLIHGRYTSKHAANNQPAANALAGAAIPAVGRPIAAGDRGERHFPLITDSDHDLGEVGSVGGVLGPTIRHHLDQLRRDLVECWRVVVSDGKVV
jgi:hypothetical protein